MVERLLVLACAALTGCAAAPGPAVQRDAALVPGPVLRAVEIGVQHPVAVAARGGEVYVLDAVQGVLRLDPLARRATLVLRGAFGPGARLALDADGSFLLLEPATRRLQRFARDGRPLGVFVIDATVGSLTDVALEPRSGRVVALDSLQRQLVAFRPLGRAFEIVPLREAPAAIAFGDDALYAADPRCPCILRLGPDGRALGALARGQVGQPGRLVVDRYGRVIVLDRPGLKVFAGDRLLQTVAGEASDLALAEDWLYVADAPGREVRMYRVLPP